jgi:hypothetical protein
MNISEAQKRVEEAERELAEAKAALLQAETQRIKPGEVWRRQNGKLVLIGEELDGSLRVINLEEDGYISNYSNDSIQDLKSSPKRIGKHLGKFDEVFIRRDLVRDVIKRALSAKDSEGDTLEAPAGMHREGCHQVAKILRLLL